MNIHVGDKISSVRRGWISLIVKINKKDIHLKTEDKIVVIDLHFVKAFLSDGMWKIVQRNALKRMQERLE